MKLRFFLLEGLELRKHALTDFSIDSQRIYVLCILSKNRVKFGKA